MYSGFVAVFVIIGIRERAVGGEKRGELIFSLASNILSLSRVEYNSISTLLGCLLTHV